MTDKQLPVPYEVGYARPPSEHRFQKGKSGNPAGRPRRSKAQPKEVNTGFGMKAAEEFLRIEAYRPVMVREGEEVIELPAIQAVFRAMGVSAITGNRFVQKTLADMVARMEAEHHASRMELFGKALDYKQSWDEEIGRCRKAGLPAPDPVPHPDDIVLDPNTGEVQILGPQTKEQKLLLEKAMARRAEAQEEVNYLAEKYRRSRDPRRKALYRESWHLEQQMFDLLDDMIGPRYKAKLKNRSYDKNASQEGKTLEAFQRNRKSKGESQGQPR